MDQRQGADRRPAVGEDDHEGQEQADPAGGESLLPPPQRSRPPGQGDGAQRDPEVPAEPVQGFRRHQPEAVVRPAQQVEPRGVGRGGQVDGEVVHAGMGALEVHAHVHVGPEDDPEGEEQETGPQDARPVRAAAAGPQTRDAVAAGQGHGEGAVTRVGEGEQGQAGPAEHGRPDSPRRVEDLLDAPEGPRQEGVEQGEGEASHDEHVLGGPEAEGVGESGDEPRGARAAEAGRQQVHAEAGEHVGGAHDQLQRQEEVAEDEVDEPREVEEDEAVGVVDGGAGADGEGPEGKLAVGDGPRRGPGVYQVVGGVRGPGRLAAGEVEAAADQRGSGEQPKGPARALEAVPQEIG